MDEVEKTLLIVDLDIARDYSGLVPERGNAADDLPHDREGIPADRRHGAQGERRGRARRRASRASRQTLAERLPIINEVNREQVELLRRFRGADTEEERERYKPAAVAFHQHIAAGLGATG